MSIRVLITWRLLRMAQHRLGEYALCLDRYIIDVSRMYNENGADVVSTTLTPGRMTVFPKGSVHTVSDPWFDSR
jgi:hypothetical protein